MSGRQFVETLKQLGYPKANSLDPQGFDWMFENESMVPFLEWFCNNVSSSNVVDPRDFSQFQTLESSGDGILEGTQLEQALRTQTAASDEGVTQETLKDEIECLTKDLQECKKRKQTLMQKRNRLSIHHTTNAHRLSKLCGVESRAKHSYKQTLEQSQTDNSRLNSSVEQLVDSVSKLNDLYDLPQQTVGSGDGDTGAMFLSQVSLDDYYKKEERFTQELTAFTKKQFFEGIAEMAGQEEGSRFEILEISDPESLLVRGESEEVNVSECQELTRLQSLYPKSELQRVNAVIGHKKVSCALQKAEDVLQSIQAGDFGADVGKITQKLQEGQSALHVVRRDLLSLAENDIPALIQESTASLVTRILTGDYNLKLTRQDYFTSNQDQVINQLVVQRSRNEFLTMAYEVEARDHRYLHRLLTAIHQQLHTQLKCWQERMAMMADSNLSLARHQRGTVDSRDKSTARLHHMLVEEDRFLKDKQLFLTYNGLTEGAEKLQHKHLSAQNALIDTSTKQEDRLGLIEHNLHVCEDMVYAGSSTTSGQPMLSPRQLVDAMTQLDDMLKKLEQSIKDVVNNVESKKKALKNDPLLMKERRLFTLFLTNPGKLKQTLEDLSSRLQAQRVQ